jgi:hypothetical protein
MSILTAPIPAAAGGGVAVVDVFPGSPYHPGDAHTFSIRSPISTVWRLGVEDISTGHVVDLGREGTFRLGDSPVDVFITDLSQNPAPTVYLGQIVPGHTPVTVTVTAGIPGSFHGGLVPRNFIDLTNGNYVASPTTPWTDGQYVLLQNGTSAYWAGHAWNTGVGHATSGGSGGTTPPPTPVATSAHAGTPGTFAPDGAAPPVSMSGITPVPSGPWNPGEYVVTATGAKYYWDGKQWQAGITPEPDAPEVPTLATGATAGSPGVFTPDGSIIPDSMYGVSPHPVTRWSSGQYIVTSTNEEFYWNGKSWTVGRAPYVPPFVLPVRMIGA